MKVDVMGAVDLLSKAWQTLAGLITDTSTVLTCSSAVYNIKISTVQIECCVTQQTD